MCKWCKITNVVDGSGHTTQHKNVISCKEKWGKFIWILNRSSIVCQPTNY